MKLPAPLLLNGIHSMLMRQHWIRRLPGMPISWESVLLLNRNRQRGAGGRVMSLARKSDWMEDW